MNFQELVPDWADEGLLFNTSVKCSYFNRESKKKMPECCSFSRVSEDEDTAAFRNACHSSFGKVR